MSNINDNKMKELDDKIKEHDDKIKELKNEIDKIKKLDDKIKELKNEIEVLDLWLTIASENGVFSKGSTYSSSQSTSTPSSRPDNCSKGSNGSSSQSIPKTFEEAQEQLKDVWNRLYQTSNSPSFNIGECETTLSRIFEFYNRAVANLRLRERFLLSGGHLLIYLASLLVVTVYSVLVLNIHAYMPSLNSDQYNIILYYSTVIGFIAGILRSMYNILHEARMRVFRRASWVEYISAPFIGGILAFGITIGIIGGIINDLQPASEQGGQEQRQRQPVQPYGLYVIAFAAGMFWRNAINKIYSILEGPKYEDKDGKIIKKE
ncbi:MAG: hypothetical protein QXS98_00110 [Candidatus Nitrosocaldus sp.]